MNEIQLAWPVVRTWAEKRVEELRQRNDDPKLDPVETAALRGEIRALKRVLHLPQELAAAATPNPFPEFPGNGSL